MSIRAAAPLSWAQNALVFVATVLAMSVLTGCASDVMKNYIGQPVESVILDYGPPTAVVELDRGERAYQWRKISTNAVSGTSSGEVRHTKHGTDFVTTETPGYIERQECFYTFYAHSSGGFWFITNFRKPKLECE